MNKKKNYDEGPRNSIQKVSKVSMSEDKLIASADLYVSGEFTNEDFVGDMDYLGLCNVFCEMWGWEIDFAINSHSLYADPADLHASIVFVDVLYHAVFSELS